jgi:hypothetical protein
MGVQKVILWSWLPATGRWTLGTGHKPETRIASRGFVIHPVATPDVHDRHWLRFRQNTTAESTAKDTALS